MHIWAQVAFGILAYPPPPDCSKKFIFALTVTGARWSNQITAHPITGLSVNGNVGLALDLVLDQGDHVIINLVHEGNIVNGDVTIAPDNVLDQGVHVFIQLFKKDSVSMVLFHSP